MLENAVCVKGGQEQRNLKMSQFVQSTDLDCFTYVENGSKNRPGVNTKEANKFMPVYMHCHLAILIACFICWTN